MWLVLHPLGIVEGDGVAEDIERFRNQFGFPLRVADKLDVPGMLTPSILVIAMVTRKVPSKGEEF